MRATRKRKIAMTRKKKKRKTKPLPGVPDALPLFLYHDMGRDKKEGGSKVVLCLRHRTCLPTVAISHYQGYQYVEVRMYSST